MKTQNVKIRAFDNRLPPEKNWFSTTEAARIVGRTNEFIRGCCENQEILHHLHGRKRKTYAIPRDGLLLYLLETASYDSREYADRLCEIIERCPPDALDRVASKIAKTSGKLAHARI